MRRGVSRKGASSQFSYFVFKTAKRECEFCIHRSRQVRMHIVLRAQCIAALQLGRTAIETHYQFYFTDTTPAFMAYMARPVRVVMLSFLKRLSR